MTASQEHILRVQRVREGGHTERCHVVPHQGSYNVAAHSWHVAQLILLLHPEPSFGLVVAALNHDVAERWIGDIPNSLEPSHLSAERQELRDAKHDLEREVLVWLHLEAKLSAEEQRWLNLCDMLELWLWCHDQLAGGNGHVAPMEQRIRLWYDQQTDVPEPINNFFVNYRWSRTAA